jgi:hypothetical protein
MDNLLIVYLLPSRKEFWHSLSSRIITEVHDSHKLIALDVFLKRKYIKEIKISDVLKWFFIVKIIIYWVLAYYVTGSVCDR